ncbi:YafY family protein [Arthrobacter sp. GMC3]|uniref:helix-turn-helix transcriptional regulator n=1 Tax=Arthrobacter sp. GMC3 TaxID=2058894 RepID=UPI000CE4369F|nr:WYL domain-containing protein [Arthrobacter sp. GMC3]
MSSPIDASERRLNLVIALLGTRRGYSRAYIRQNINGYARTAATASAEATASVAFERMFERDKETLRELGIPIATTISHELDIEDQALYRIKPGEYRVPEIRLNEPEMTLLAVAANLWSEAAFSEAAQSALRKIATRSGASWYDDDTTVQSRIRTQEPAFEPLWGALRQGNAVSFSYKGAGASNASPRRVQPWGLGNKYGEWYLAGLDLEKSAPRNFRLSRIQSEVVVLDGERLRPPDGFSIASVLDGLGNQDPYRGTVHVRVGSGHSLRSQEGSTVIATGDPEGLDTLSITYREPELMADDLAALGHQAVALEPASLRASVVSRLLGAAAAATSGDPDGGQFGPRMAVAPAKKKDSRDRLLRLLSMVPFLVANPGIEESELATEFGISTKQLAKDLATLTVSGLPGYLHGDLMDVSNEEGQVFIRDAETLASPLRLTQEEACALLVGLDALSAIPGTREAQSLRNAIDALKLVAGKDAWLADAVALHLVSSKELETITRLQALIGEEAACEITYLVRSRDELTLRVIEPKRIYSVNSAWYVRAWCRRAEEMRSFRVENIRSLQQAGPQITHPAMVSPAMVGTSAGVYTPGVNDVEVHLVADSTTAKRLAPAYGATLHLLPAGTHGTDQLGVRLLVGEQHTIPPLMARLGGHARVVHPPALREATAAWLSTAVANYGIDAPNHAVGENTPATPSQDG